jgi:hypothetical protein
MLNDDEGHAAGNRNMAEKLLERFQSARRRANRDDREEPSGAMWQGCSGRA